MMKSWKDDDDDYHYWTRIVGLNLPVCGNGITWFPAFQIFCNFPARTWYIFFNCHICSYRQQPNLVSGFHHMVVERYCASLPHNLTVWFTLLSSFLHNIQNESSLLQSTESVCGTTIRLSVSLFKSPFWSQPWLFSFLASLICLSKYGITQLLPYRKMTKIWVPLPLVCFCSMLVFPHLLLWMFKTLY